MASKLLLSVFRGVWAIDERAVAAGLKMVEDLVNNGQVTSFENDNEEEEKKYKFNLQVVGNNYKSSFKSFSNTDAVPENSVAVIPIQDVIMKEDYCGSPGTDTMQQWLDAANQHPNICGIVLSIDSPGGSADAMLEMAEAVKNSAKPVVAHGGWLMASAAYGIGSCASEIMLGQEVLSEVGSIGTMMQWRDWTKAYEGMGVKTHEVYATASKDKNQVFKEAQKGNYKPLINHSLDPFNNEFLSMVQVNRAGKLNLKKENVLTGKTYHTADAIKYGLADSTGKLNTAIERVKQLANKN